MAWYDAALVGIFNDIIETDGGYELPASAGKTAFEFLGTLREADPTAKPIHISASIETRAAVAAQDKDAEFVEVCKEVYLDLETMADGEWEEEHWVVERTIALSVMSMFIDIAWADTIHNCIWDARQGGGYLLDDDTGEDGGFDGDT